jgi:hypothetical protein
MPRRTLIQTAAGDFMVGSTTPSRSDPAGRAVATARGWEFNWRFVSRPGVGHNRLQMFAGSFAYNVVFKETV